MSAKIFHIPFIAASKTLVLDAIVQRRPSPGDSAPDDHPGIKHFTSVANLLADPAIDVVIVSTPPNTHYAFTTDALTAGKHVLVEKPFVPTSVEADALVELARRRGRLLCVYQNRRWDADFLTVRQMLRDGTLGRIYEMDMHFDRLRRKRPENWKGSLRMRDGGGALYDLGTHLIDQAFVLFGMPSEVSGTLVNQREGRIVRSDGEAEEDEPDSVSAQLVYEATGVLVNVRIGVLSVMKHQRRFWVRGTLGSYAKEGLDPQEDQLKAGVEVTAWQFGREPEQDNGRATLNFEERETGIVTKAWPSAEPETYLKFYELFASALESGREEDVPVPGHEAAQVLRIIEAIRESAKAGRGVRFSP